jgi:Domain of unknown function (DUF4129)
VEHSPAGWVLIALSLAVLLPALANIGRIARWSHERWLRAHPERSPEQAAAIWYERMARTLAKLGIERSPVQTPHEFLNNITDERLREPVSRFTDVYESARFGNSAEQAQRLPELYEEVEVAMKRQ